MSITLELPPEMDSKLRARASRRGMTPEDYLKAIALDRLRPRRTPGATLTPQEKEVIVGLNGELTREFWQRFYHLQDSARTAISDDEHEELMRLVSRTEEWNVRRLTILMNMAKQRSMDTTTFMRRNKIYHHPVAEELSADYRSRE